MQSGPAWVDVQPWLSRLSAELRPGQLVHGEHFSLFDAMSAIEVGNPRMDPGVARPSEKLSLEETAPLRLASLLNVKLADQLMAQEVSWYSGNTLPQTVFTCLYLLNPERYASLGLGNEFVPCSTRLYQCIPLLKLLSYYSAQASHKRQHAQSSHYDHVCRLEHNGLLRAVCKSVRATCSIIRELAQAATVVRVRPENLLVIQWAVQAVGPLCEIDTDHKCSQPLFALQPGQKRHSLAHETLHLQPGQLLKNAEGLLKHFAHAIADAAFGRGCIM